jgi:hypothetical protein
VKTVKIKKDGKTFHQFTITDAQLELAKKLGLSKEQYYKSAVLVELDEKKEKESK